MVSLASQQFAPSFKCLSVSLLSPALEYVVKNALYHLKGKWSLYVFHGLSNKEFVHKALTGISNVNVSTASLPVDC